MLKVVKIGGNVVDNPAMLEKFTEEFAQLPGEKILVHGGGVMAGKVQEALGVEVVKIQGRRVTDAETLRVVTMVYAGLCNKNIVSLLQSRGCNAIGLAGCDASVITARRRPPIDIEGSMVDFGFVGDVTAESVSVPVVRALLDAGMVPVFCAINHDGKGNLLNTNADTIASSVASALGAELVTCFEKRGVLRDKDDDDSVIAHINPESFERMKQEGSISDGMIPKLQNAFKALREGAVKVTIKHSSELLSDSGTVISL